MMLKYCLSFFLLTALSLVAKAQEPETRENVLCTTHRTIWRGTNADIKNIHSNPIPESYRRELEKDWCRHTDPTDLIIWHHKFGSEETMRAALKYLEGAVQIWGVGLISRGKDAKPTPKHRTEDYALISRYYTMGAQAFPSLDFIMSAERYQEKTKILCDKLSPDWLNPTWRSGCRMRLGVSVIEKLSRKIAVTRALISGKKSDLESAKLILERAEIPLMDKFVENASKSFKGLCETRHSKLSKDIQEVCAKGYDEHDVRELLQLQTLLATMEDRFSDKPHPNKSYELYSSLYPMLIVTEAYELDEYTGLIPPALGQHRHLRIAFSDMHFYRALKQAENKSDEDNITVKDVAENIDLSLDQLLAAEKETPRYSSPSQWRQIAEKFVDRMEVWNQLDSDVRNRLDSSKSRERQLDYFKDGLDQ